MSIKTGFTEEEKKEHKKEIFLPQGKSYAFEKMISEITRSQEKKEIDAKKAYESKLDEIIKP